MYPIPVIRFPLSTAPDPCIGIAKRVSVSVRGGQGGCPTCISKAISDTAECLLYAAAPVGATNLAVLWGFDANQDLATGTTGEDT